MLSFRFRKLNMQRYLQFVLLFCLFGFILGKSIPEAGSSILVKRIRRQQERHGGHGDRSGCQGRKFKDIDEYLNWLRMCK